jgi:hypothetical protein
MLAEDLPEPEGIVFRVIAVPDTSAINLLEKLQWDAVSWIAEPIRREVLRLAGEQA